MFLVLSVTAAAVLQGCTAGRLKATDLYDRQILQEGVLAAPTGPHMLGPQLEPGQASVTGALEYSQPRRANATRSQGASGAALALAWGRAQVGVGVTDYFQLGFELEGSPAGLAMPVATDVTADAWPGLAVRGGVDTRFHFDAGRASPRSCTGACSSAAGWAAALSSRSARPGSGPGRWRRQRRGCTAAGGTTGAASTTSTGRSASTLPTRRWTSP